MLHRWLSTHVEGQGFAWLDEKCRRIAESGPERVFFTSFSAVPRYTGKKNLALTQDDLQEAETLHAGWQPGHWSADQVGRALLVLSLPYSDADTYVATLERLFTNADLGEALALYQSLPLLPYPARHRARAAEGIRSNITSVFNAVALRNPYPADCLDEHAWNQMVLKAVFVGSPLYLIHGLDRRANPTLARMLVDYAHERWAARRFVTPELWRPVGSYVDDARVSDLERVLSDPDPAQQEAAALALAQSCSVRAHGLLSSRPELQSSIVEGRLNWDSFSRNRLANNAA